MLIAAFNFCKSSNFYCLFACLYYRFLMPNHLGSIDHVIEHVPDSMKQNFKHRRSRSICRQNRQTELVSLCLFKAAASRRVRPLSRGQYKLLGLINHPSKRYFSMQKLRCFDSLFLNTENYIPFTKKVNVYRPSS
jgi:hypothetical protein